MKSNSLSQPQLIGLGVAAIFPLMLILWVSWKISKLVIRVSVALLVAAAICAGLWWLLAGR